MPARLVAVSERAQDFDFGVKIAKDYGLEFVPATTHQMLSKLLLENPQTIVYWDVDHPGATDAKHPLAAAQIGRVLMQNISSQRVLAVSDKPLNETPYLFNIRAFDHHIFRRYESPADRVYGKIALACVMPNPFGAAQYVPDETAVQRITLKKSGQRAAAVEAVQNIYLKRGGAPRMGAMIAGTCDELLMNAFFSAPVNAEGVHYRKTTDRGEDFELKPSEIVTLELASTPEYLVVSIADQFGSLKKTSVLPFLEKDYRSQTYRPQDHESSAGLGLYRIINAGQSLIFVTKPKVKTEVVLIFPIVQNVKALRESFRFISFIVK